MQTPHIRALTLDDLDALHALASRPAIASRGVDAPFFALEKRRAWLENLLAQHFVFGAFDGATLIGWAELTPYKARRAHVAGFAVAVHEAWHRRGVGSALTRAALDLADNWLGLRRIELHCYTDNAAAVALYRKHGFAVEAVQRAAVLRDGVLTDAYAMARLKHAPAWMGDGATAVLSMPDCESEAVAPTRRDSPLPHGDETVAVRAASSADAAAISALHQAPRVMRNTLAVPYRSTQWVEDWMQRNAHNAGINLCAEADGTVVGHAALMVAASLRAHSALLAICVTDDYAGRGIGTRLMRELIDFADRALGLRRIELTVFTDNASAIALYRRFGFVVEGRARAMALRDGECADTFHMARLVEAPAMAALPRV
jgi:L-phenylalanine/L-methionine N-acetyltransferase